MTTQEITLNHNSDDGLYTKLLRGRYVTSIENEVITLDDGTAGGGVRWLRTRRTGLLSRARLTF